jgi:hypothetical protein
MKLRKLLITTLAVLAIGSIGMNPAVASGYGNHKSNYCSQTAKQMHQACSFDVFDDYNEAQANCINVNDAGARAECYAELKDQLREDRFTCREQKHARLNVCDAIGEARYADPLKDPSIVFIDPDEIGAPYAPNPYVNLTPGHTYVLRAGEDFEETVVVHVTDEVREAEGADGMGPVLCRVVVDAVMIFEQEEGEAEGEWVEEEITDDYFAQDDTGIVYYCGEISRNYEDGYLVNVDGSFFSGVEQAKAGVLMRAAPEVGQVDRLEYAIGEAEDLVEYLSLSAVPGEDEGGPNTNDASFECNGSATGDCLMTFDSSALDPESTEYKYYRRDVGFVLAVSLEDGEIDGEREELLCTGDSLDVLSDCGGLVQAEDLLERLCEISPQAFCED